MNFYIDGLFYKGAGIGRYYESLLKGLAKKGMKIYTCVPVEFKKDFEIDFKQYSKNILPIYVNYKKFSVKGFWKQGKILKKLEKEVSVFHFPHINLPIYAPENFVVTIHDLCPFTEFWDRSYLKRKVFEWYFKRTIKKAKKIITISKSSKEEITNIYPAYGAKIIVIYRFVDEKFLINKDYHNKERLIKDDYILFIGNRKKHKNLSRLILAFDQVKNIFPNVKLVIAGQRDKAEDEVDLLRERLNLKEKIIEVISPDDEEIINLYKYAKAFIFPSLYEGFGLPPLEAMAIGTPVLASDIPVLKEICGDAAYFFNPYDIEDMAKAICKVVTDESLRRSLIERGKERVKFFDSESAIDQHVQLYKELSRN
ncbi:MAG: Glycosyltransferase involved in cell wall bisynthesis [Thermodesulfobacterium sp.]|uniref:Glycosyltransferase involved in cell wall bisynthesis n=1 Tax=Candidatus Thermodesulfobacterium syntrophicum TaxID=3060442 RepID=A0AAE3P3R1_9BACT|nr:Glycosyltransferase involved in cell wall bisynthesis [Candidatus Thermodesulfobacterium syntrophicum]